MDILLIISNRWFSLQTPSLTRCYSGNKTSHKPYDITDFRTDVTLVVNDHILGKIAGFLPSLKVEDSDVYPPSS